MKLEPKAKPVRIRIKSGGEEHSTLESLKMNFSVDDLKPAVEDRRLSRWLKQQGQNELAEGVLRYQGKMKSLSGNDYLGFIKLFFANEPNIETVTDDCSLAAFFHDKWKKNFERVFNRCCESKGFTAIHYFYRTYKDEKTTDSWIKHFEGLKDSLEPKDMANCLSELAILYGERNMPYNQIKCICASIELGDKNAIKDFQSISDAYDFPKGLKAFIKEQVPDNAKDDFLRSLSESYIELGQHDIANELFQFCKEEPKQEEPNKKSQNKKEVRNAIDYTKSYAPRLSQILNNDMKEYNEKCLALAENHLRKGEYEYLTICAKYISAILKCINGKDRSDFSSVHILDDFMNIRSRHIFPTYRITLHQFLYGLCCEYISGGSDKNHYESGNPRTLGGIRKGIQCDCLISADNGFSCVFPKQINKQSFIKMALFAMETCEITYSCKTLSQ